MYGIFQANPFLPRASFLALSLLLFSGATLTAHVAEAYTDEERDEWFEDSESIADQLYEWEYEQHSGGSTHRSANGRVENFGDATIGGTLRDSSGEDGPTAPQSPTAGDPVVTFSGELLHTEKDLSYAGPLALEFKRVYRSKSSSASTLGSNWSHNFDVRLLVGFADETTRGFEPCVAADGGDCLAMLDEGTHRIFYRPPGSSFFVEPNRPGSVLNETSDGWELTGKAGGVVRFNTEGYPEEVADRHGNWLRMEYETTPLYSAYLTNCVFSAAQTNAIDMLCSMIGASLKEEQPRAWRRQPPYSEYEIPSINTPGFFLTDDEEAEVQRLFTASHRGAGWTNSYSSTSMSPVFIPATPADGGNRFRITRAYDGLGREITFAYHGGDAPFTGLLSSVTGTFGEKISYSYESPDSTKYATVDPDPQYWYITENPDTGEWFLTEASRTQATSIADPFVEQGSTHKTIFKYDWHQKGSAFFGVAAMRYFGQMRDAFDDQCFHQGAGEPASFAGIIGMERVRSATVDNITEIFVEYDGDKRLVVESAYERAFSEGTQFDRVIGQFYGGSDRDTVAEVAGRPQPTEDQAGQPPGSATPEPFLFSYETNRQLGGLPDSILTSRCNAVLPKFADEESPVSEALEVPAQLLARYETGGPSGIDNLGTDCAEVVRINSEGLPAHRTVLEHTNAIVELRNRNKSTANSICSWTKTRDRDGRVAFTGFNQFGAPLVRAAFDVENDAFVVEENQYDGLGRLTSSYWPLEDLTQTALLKTSVKYQECGFGLGTWSESAWKGCSNVRTVTNTPRTPVVRYEIDEGELTVNTTQTKFAYEEAFNEIHRQQDLTYVNGESNPRLVREAIFDYQCAASPPSGCDPSLFACARSAQLRDLLEDAEALVTQIYDDEECVLGDCTAQQALDISQAVTQYNAASAEIATAFPPPDLDFALDPFPSSTG